MIPIQPRTHYRKFQRFSVSQFQRFATEAPILAVFETLQL
jgi:hypothetical protein